MNKPLTIGYLARAASVNIETVRYYQRIGLIEEPKKPSSGYRIYSTETVDRIKFIKSAQPLGFSLQEIAELLDLGDGQCDDVRLHAEQKRSNIDQQIKELTKLRKTLDKLIKSCNADNAQCPIIKSLAGQL
ncbi:hypothetical protein MNBD_GAMMA21-1805 [hydrothermal vent metagenome]|uniref:Mercuric resistance operon regulatory protein n=1 Tax=hydrothermal vent metagenome TaxID=652676 RepID=A0A3B1ADS5_9ZZZZ